jgi:AcrR family transcriptional regulator
MSEARKTKYKRGVSTRQRIVERSVELFNRGSVQSVAIEQIASDLGMSPGNLTYHFRHKRDLIRAALYLLQQRLRETVGRPTIKSPRQAGIYVVHGLRALWEFRFFFNSLVYLLGNDPELRAEYQEFQHWAVAAVAEDLRQLQASGNFTPPEPPNSVTAVVENMWAQWLNWLRMQQIDNPLAVTPRNEALYDCAFHIWSLCQPYLHPAFAQAVLNEFETLLADVAQKPSQFSTTISET